MKTNFCKRFVLKGYVDSVIINLESVLEILRTNQFLDTGEDGNVIWWQNPSDNGVKIIMLMKIVLRIGFQNIFSHA